MIEVPELEVGPLRTPALSIAARPPRVTVRRRGNPVLQLLKFALGLLFGLIVGCVIAALLAPAAGEDTRQRLMDSTKRTPTPPGPDPESAARRDDLMTGGLGGLLKRPQLRLQMALEAFKAERDGKEQELKEAFHKARRSGGVPPGAL